MRKQFNQNIRQHVLNKYDGHCAYCGIKITEKSMQIDHIKPVCFGGDNEFQNLNPACKDCNLYKGASSVGSFRVFTEQLINTKLEYLFKSKTKMQVAINFGAITLKKWDGYFYFEKIETK